VTDWVDTWRIDDARETIAVLAIEDNALSRAAIEATLKGRAKVVACPNLACGLDELAKKGFDVILLDLNLPDSESLATFTTVHKVAPTTPIIIVSADEDRELAVQAVNLGAQDFLIKSNLEKDDLWRSIRYAQARQYSERLRQQLNSFVQNESRFRHTFEKAPIGIFLADYDNNILRANDAFCRLLGYTEAELKQCTALSLTSPDDVADTVRYLRLLQNGDQGEGYVEKRYLNKAGGVVWVQQSGRLLKEGLVETGTTLTMVRDFTKERQAKQFLRVQLDVAKSVSKCGTLGELSKQVLGSISEALEGVYGELWIYNRDFDSFGCADVYSAEGYDCEAMRNFAEHAVVKGAGAFGGACTDGQIRWFDHKASDVLSGRSQLALQSHLHYGVVAPINVGDSVGGAVLVLGSSELGDDKECLGFLSSVTSLIGQFLHMRGAEERARRALLVEQREEFISTLAHDLKTPIAGANRMLELLIDGVLGELQPQQNDVIRKLKDSNLAQLRMIQNLLHMYRYESGTNALEISEVNVPEVVSQVVNNVQPIADSQAVTIEIDSRYKGSVNADYYAITRLLQNLLDNAVKHTPQGGSVTVVASMEAGNLLLSVQDTGAGIPFDVQPRLFKRFSQGGGRFVASGSGLGLYLCKQIVDAHGGTIAFESQPEKGSTFQVRLPLVHKVSAVARIDR